jgi:hypothetical protein
MPGDFAGQINALIRAVANLNLEGEGCQEKLITSFHNISKAIFPVKCNQSIPLTTYWDRTEFVVTVSQLGIQLSGRRNFPLCLSATAPLRYAQAVIPNCRCRVPIDFIKSMKGGRWSWPPRPHPDRDDHAEKDLSTQPAAAGSSELGFIFTAFSRPGRPRPLVDLGGQPWGSRVIRRTNAQR